MSSYLLSRERSKASEFLIAYINSYVMEGRLHRCSFYLKCQDHHLEDLISRLPDEILVNILSLLTMKEAGRSCVLSSRWRDLWKLTTVLNFDALNFVGTKREILEPARSKYVGWVDQVTKLHKRPCLDEFKVGFCLNSVASSSIDEWVRFSIQKGVRRLEIDLKNPYQDEHYTLSQECYACFTNPSNLSRVKRLTSLSLTSVNINGQLLQYLLLNCPLLEQVFICHSDHLLNLEVVGPSLQLKHLEIINCNFLESLELSAPKLLTFKYFGKSLRLLEVGDLPLLTDLYLGSHHQVTYALIQFSSNFSQLETLELFMRWKDNEEIPQLPKLKNLKCLKLKLLITSDRGLLNLTKLIEAAPALHKFTIESECYSVFEEEQVYHYRPHQCLKHVEMLGFGGSIAEIQFAKYLLRNAINIETIIIDPYYPYTPEACPKFKKKDAASAGRYARKIRALVRPGAKFVVK